MLPYSSEILTSKTVFHSCERALLTSSRWHKWVYLSWFGIHGLNCVNHLMDMKQTSRDTHTPVCRMLSLRCELFYVRMIIKKRTERQTECDIKRAFSPQTVWIKNHTKRHLFLVDAWIFLMMPKLSASFMFTCLCNMYQFCFFTLCKSQNGSKNDIF